MKRLLKILGFIVIALVVTAGVSLFKAGKLSIPQSGDTKVLGATKEKVGSILTNLQPTISRLSNSVSGGVSSATTAVLKPDQKIYIDKAFDDVKNNAADIPEDLFMQAKYNYCKQVIEDYEKTR